MYIGIIDADLISKKRHRFPNLACMKLSRYYKSAGHEVELKLDYDNLDRYDKVFISKVFTDTPVPDRVLTMPNVEYGGTGFFYDKAPNLPEEIEHSKPDYNLYDSFIKSKFIYDDETGNILNRAEFKYYLDYSIGFITRGCFRKCSFCVNKKYDRVFKHSPLHEFLDVSKPKICLLDDNFFGCSDWRELLQELKATGKPFQFKQGLDERLLTDDKCRELFSSKYDGEYIFAFDNIKDKYIIEAKLRLIRRYADKKKIKFYVFCAFNHDTPDTYHEFFWAVDILELFERIKLLMRYKCLPYVMRYKDYELSPYRGLYIAIASWCNQPHIFNKKSLREFAQADFDRGYKSTLRYLQQFEEVYPEIAEQYYDMKWGTI